MKVVIKLKKQTVNNFILNNICYVRDKFVYKMITYKFLVIIYVFCQ